MVNYLSVDLESWASPNLPEFVNLPSKKKKALDKGHIKKSALAILEILKKSNIKITFFVVGQLYEWYPEVVEKIATDGHEIAYHTHAHDVLEDKTTLVRSINLSKKFLQRYKPIGFRAPRIYMDTSHLHVLKKYGFKYDSSTYGPFSEKRKIDGVYEFPVSAIGKIPIGSGYFIGLLGKNVNLLYRTVNKKNVPVISFIHNWQVVRAHKPTFPTTLHIITHPYYLPYLTDCFRSFEYLLKKLSIAPMKNLLK
ncbi:hypothetical protein A3G67_03190 [Candidatus Roizmanbacteria bacterium RIFCSPLOWO2_12_FULL_40_12]|uniref:NodB homology domain-containing protein n=1 Tax=Candidatus Roizmanbacteria bacterium RIFCSPLOWO2_01_FULL_40_42 TaxID=1802066 RepID=A0A1F7J5E2_9BACT|nr:MAG: hypothetical protein A2779_02825 [Candidatus Roizmanbacteria bacterium RIFCSPHIGHO2_01_FULL_40_98]OGK28275.1 MAG: hypothetical protein A3C31_00190 [Candidatus Roizmanbacteria bacterium RIFCSPHIGHO2_02_FULL_40_53]OGK30511.1 MAG: hypothetical protein A2W49_02875 [Candidatus Roizmanbacteria bacterium RIFCSPHIGHO2_12_41_18]OGK36925.1 MAG: hypothetical protein A3E69_00450 [Candidatus Roizmanbacteria bacterium RIFCSPHIGHO2_12_FULL_40_130]OGK50831.1 MAG: hypothetical protein A3B50_00960 [Candi